MGHKLQNITFYQIIYTYKNIYILLERSIRNDKMLLHLNFSTEKKIMSENQSLTVIGNTLAAVENIYLCFHAFYISFINGADIDLRGKSTFDIVLEVIEMAFARRHKQSV